MSARAESVVPVEPVTGRAASGQASWELIRLRHQSLREGGARREPARGGEPLRAGDAVLLDARTAYRVSAAEHARVAVADLRLVVPPSPVPSPLVVRDFSRRHHGVHELVRTCPLQAEGRSSAFAASYGGLIGASMLVAWLQDEGLGDQPPADAAVSTVVSA